MIAGNATWRFRYGRVSCAGSDTTTSWSARLSRSPMDRAPEPLPRGRVTQPAGHTMASAGQAP